MRLTKRLGDQVAEGEKVGVVSDPFGDREEPIVADHDGIVIGKLNLPVVNRGDAALHVARPPGEDDRQLPAVREALQDFASHEDWAI